MEPRGSPRAGKSSRTNAEVRDAPGHMSSPKSWRGPSAEELRTDRWARRRMETVDHTSSDQLDRPLSRAQRHQAYTKRDVSPYPPSPRSFAYSRDRESHAIRTASKRMVLAHGRAGARLCWVQRCVTRPTKARTRTTRCSDSQAARRGRPIQRIEVIRGRHSRAITSAAWRCDTIRRQRDFDDVSVLARVHRTALEPSVWRGGRR